jgi:hypothetical protein
MKLSVLLPHLIKLLSRFLKLPEHLTLTLAHADHGISLSLIGRTT